MKLTHKFLSLLLVFTLLLSVCSLASCDLLIKKPNSEAPGTEHPVVDPITQTESKNPAEFDTKFYDASNWVHMTNNNGTSRDGGALPVSLNDGSIKFHYANQAIDLGDHTNKTLSFLLKGTNDWAIWFNSIGIDNHTGSSYQLKYVNDELIITLSSNPNEAVAKVGAGLYNKAAWNRFDIAFSNDDGMFSIMLYINGKLASLSDGKNNPENCFVAGDTLVSFDENFQVGKYIVVKVWSAQNYLQIKPVAKINEKDVPIIACVGDSITQGAGASNEYLTGYPAQLQKELGGQYNVVNLGLSGTTAGYPSESEAWLNNVHWTGFQAIVPDIVILALGTNDSKYSPNHDKFYADYQNVVDKLLAVNPKMKIIVSTAPTAHSRAFNIKNSNIQSVISPVQKEIAEKYNFDVVDICSITENMSSIFPDGIHPNDTGYVFFAKIYAKAITEGVPSIDESFLNQIK